MAACGVKNKSVRSYWHRQEIEGQHAFSLPRNGEKKFNRLAQWMTTSKYCILHVSKSDFWHTSPVFHCLALWWFWWIWYYLWPMLNVSIVFYTHWEDAEQQSWFLGSAHTQCSIVFYMLWEDGGQQSWVPGSAHIQLFYTIRGLMECKCMYLSAIIIGLYGRERS